MRWRTNSGLSAALAVLALLGAVAVTVTSSPSAVAATATAGTFGSVAPTRMLDTRSGVGAPAHALAANASLAVQVTGSAGIPASGVSAVVVNVTALSASKSGYLIGWASGTPRAHASIMNFTAGRDVANEVVLPVGADGRIALYNGSAGSVQLLGDVSGYYLEGSPSLAGAFAPLEPTRLLDTRSGTGAPASAVAAGGTLAVRVTGSGGVPASGVSAVVLNVTALSASKSGYLIGWANGTSRAHASILNFTSGQDIANEVVLPVGVDGRIALYNGSTGSVQLIGDVAGYYLAGQPSVAGTFGSVAPARLLDTRSGVGATAQPVAAGGTVAVRVTGAGGVPKNGVAAVVLNVTALSASKSGYLIGWANGTARAHASILNFAAGQEIANEVVLPVGADGRIALYNGAAGSVQLLADVSGYYLDGTAGSGIGNDVSWPQCGTKLPSDQAFGIVGVNDGLANNTNPCFASELNWAENSVGGTAQERVALYLNTGNPGPASASWPTSNQYPGNTPVSNPYGTCTGTDSTACAYVYGYARAYDDVAERGVPTPTAFRWWLDVETTNSWESNTAANVADLEGMTRYLQDAGIRVGIYASNYQWGVIAGRVSTSSNLSTLPNWIPGAGTLAEAQANCLGKPLMAGSITLSQYEAGGLDYDNSCS